MDEEKKDLEREGMGGRTREVRASDLMAKILVRAPNRGASVERAGTLFEKLRRGTLGSEDMGRGRIITSTNCVPREQSNEGVRNR